MNTEAVRGELNAWLADQCIGYLPLLMKKPGALRNGAPFKNWDLPPALCGSSFDGKQ